MCVDSIEVSFYICDVALLEDLVRTLFRTSLILVLGAALVGIRAMGMPANPASAPLGVVLQAERAQVGVDITSNGATIYEGDRLETLYDGNLHARLGGSQMYLRPNTATEVHGLSNGFSASLLHGTVVASSPEGQTFRLLANGATIRPAGTQATVAQVTWVNANELLLTSTRGAIEVSLGDEVKTIEAGSSYRMETQDEDTGQGPQGQQGSGAPPAHTGRRRRAFFFLIGGTIAVGTGIGIWRVLISPSDP
jgi:hypothetical protein